MDNYNRTNYLIIFLLFTALMSCSDAKNEKQPYASTSENTCTIILVKPQILDTIKHSKSSFTILPKPITYCKEGSFIEEELKYTQGKTDTISIKTTQPIYLSLQYGLQFVNTYKIAVGDTVFITFKNHFPYLTDKQTGRIQKALSYFNETEKPAEDELSFFSRNGRFKNDAEKASDSLLLKKRKNKLESYLKALYAKKEIDSLEYQLGIIPLLNIRTLETEKASVILRKSYNFAIGANCGLVIAAFEKLHKPALIRLANQSMIDYEGLYNSVWADTAIHTDTKKYLLFYYLKQLAVFSSKETFAKYFQMFISYSKSKEAEAYFKRCYPKLFAKSNYTASNLALVSARNEKTTLKKIVAEHRGKLVYVDFWASWCAPCRAAMPASRELQRKFPDVIFIYISIDEFSGKWLEASKREKINPQYSFLATEFPYGLFFKSHNISSIPRYMLFDKKGVLVDANAPHPDDRKIEAALKQLR